MTLYDDLEDPEDDKEYSQTLVIYTPDEKFTFENIYIEWEYEHLDDGIRVWKLGRPVTEYFFPTYTRYTIFSEEIDG